MKRKILSIAACTLLLLQGCNKEVVEPVDEPEVEEVTMIENDLYKAPTNPTQEHIVEFNKLSTAVKEENYAEEAKQVAVCFTYDFFDLSSKSGSDDIGGLQYIPSGMVEEFTEYANMFYYTNYDLITNQYGEASLPMIKSHEVTAIEPGFFEYQGVTYDGYEVILNVVYRESKLSAEAMKTRVELQLINMEDVDYDEYQEYLTELENQNYEAPAPLKHARYKVIKVK